MSQTKKCKYCNNEIEYPRRLYANYCKECEHDWVGSSKHDYSLICLFLVFVIAIPIVIIKWIIYHWRNLMSGINGNFSAYLGYGESYWLTSIALLIYAAISGFALFQISKFTKRKILLCVIAIPIAVLFTAVGCSLVWAGEYIAFILSTIIVISGYLGIYKRLKKVYCNKIRVFFVVFGELIGICITMTIAIFLFSADTNNTFLRIFKSKVETESKISTANQKNAILSIKQTLAINKETKTNIENYDTTKQGVITAASRFISEEKQTQHSANIEDELIKKQVQIKTKMEEDIKSKEAQQPEKKSNRKQKISKENNVSDNNEAWDELEKRKRKQWR